MAHPDGTSHHPFVINHSLTNRPQVGGRELQPQDIQGFEVAVLSARSSRSISEVILEAGETNGPLEAGLDVSYRNVTYGLPGGWKADAQ